jgi:N-acetylglucosaminyldiphosphoundecaprenol N-acetyl-beta-D-mannosaminyltransferase
MYSPNIIAGYRNGYFTKDEELDIAKDIANSGAQLLFVAITSPKKEKFLYQYKDIFMNSRKQKRAVLLHSPFKNLFDF